MLEAGVSAAFTVLLETALTAHNSCSVLSSRLGNGDQPYYKRQLPLWPPQSYGYPALVFLRGCYCKGGKSAIEELRASPPVPFDPALR